MTPPWLKGNQLTLLRSGMEYFPALIKAIDMATQEIFLETYIFANDATGQSVCQALCRAAQRGVIVNVTVDGFGGRNFKQDFLPILRAAGVRAMLYRPEISPWHFRRHRLRRLHRKLAVIDATVGFVGGINLIADDNAPCDMIPRYDYAVRVEGPLLEEMHRAARKIWEVAAWVALKRRLRLTPPAPTCCPVRGKQTAAFLIRDNIRHRHEILNAYLNAIHNAKESILIANAYFLPGLRFGRALQAAAERGVNIRIVLQGKTDHPLLQRATQTLYGMALKLGIRVFEYEKSFMHAKVAVIDGEWATVGSSNIDPFSLLLAKEANLFVHDRQFAQCLTEDIETALQEGAREIHPETLQRQTWWQKTGRWLSYGLVRLLVGMTGYGPKHWQADEAPSSPPTGSHENAAPDQTTN